VIVKSQLKSHEVKKADNDTKFEVTKELIRQCYKHGYSKKDTHLVMNFFDWVIRLPEIYKDRLREVIKKIEEEFKMEYMEYIPLWERDARNEGRKEGQKIGQKKTAKELMKRGVDMDIIEGATGIPREELEKMALKVH